MKKLGLMVSLIVFTAMVAFSGCEQQQPQQPQPPGGEQSAPTTSPTTTTPRSPGYR